MNLKKCLVLALILGSFSIAESPRGAVPRADAGAYAAHGGQTGFQVGASLLTHKELKKIFATDVNECCLVVEVAFYPAKDNFVKSRSMTSCCARRARKSGPCPPPQRYWPRVLKYAPGQPTASTVPA